MILVLAVLTCCAAIICFVTWNLRDKIILREANPQPRLAERMAGLTREQSTAFRQKISEGVQSPCVRTGPRSPALFLKILSPAYYLKEPRGFYLAVEEFQNREGSHEQTSSVSTEINKSDIS